MTADDVTAAVIESDLRPRDKERDDKIFAKLMAMESSAKEFGDHVGAFRLRAARKRRGLDVIRTVCARLKFVNTAGPAVRVGRKDLP